MTRSSGSILMLALALAAAGCTPWVVVRQTEPSPLAGARALAVQAVDFSMLRVGEKSQAEYLASKDAGQQESFRADLGAMNQNFFERLHEATTGLTLHPGPAAGGPPLLVRPVVTWIEPGFYAGIVASPTRVELTLQVLDRANAVLDEIRVEVSVPADITNPSSGGRLRSAANALGRICAGYLRQRTGLEH